MTVSVETLYRSLSTASLEQLREAFKLDRLCDVDLESRAFIDGRLRLIAQELARRPLVVSEGVSSV